MAKKLKLIKGASSSPLKKLNEGKLLKNPDKYVFEGVFTACSTPEHKIINRNGRIYMENEVLRHLGYLRDMIKDNNGRILGELDHPEGRFDVQMKEASHMITDLWYDLNTHCVMGRLEVLDTPNGKTLKSLIEAGFPLYVSSRAAGDVDPKTKEVEIAQIFTYDVVCTPGFKEAKLERVDESLLSTEALQYLNESKGITKKAKVKDINVPESAINENVKKYKNINMNDVCKPLNENDEQKDNEKSLNDDIKNFFPIMNTSGSVQKAANEISEEDEDDTTEDDKNIEGEDSIEDDNNDSEEPTEEVSDDDDEEKTELTDEEKEENREKIIKVVGLDADGNKLGDDDDKSDDIESIEGIEADEDEDEDEDSEDTEDKSDDDSDEDETNEDTESSEELKNEATKSKEKANKLKKDTDKDIAELESILDSVEKKEAVKESIVRRYPFAAALTESNFAKFAQLRPKQKKRVADFIDEYQIYDITAINELWLTPLREDKKVQQNWLKLASQSDIDLYVASPFEVQNAIEEQAQYFVMETEEDVNEFWDKTGLRQAAMRKAMNEKMVADYKEHISKNGGEANESLGYDDYFIKMTEEFLKNDF